MDAVTVRLLDDYAAHVRAIGGQGPRTADEYRADARKFIEYLTAEHPGTALQEVTATHVARWLMYLEATGLTAATRKRRLLGLRSFFKWVYADDPAKNPAKAVPTPRVPPIKTEVFIDDEVRQILDYAAALTDLRGRVGHTALVTFFTTGLRLSEITSLRMADLDLTGRRLRVTGKGDKERRVPIAPMLVATLLCYLDEVRPRLPGEVYLLSNPKSRRLGPHYGRFSPQALALHVKKLAADAGITGKVNPHKWRHTYATKVLRGGSDLHTVQRLLGHENLDTTVRYLHLVDDDLRAAVDRAFQI